MKRFKPPSRYDLYQRTVQDVAALVPFLRAIHGRQPTTLAEDFCGSAACSIHWARTIKGGRAIATDIDPEPLTIAKRSSAKLAPAARRRVRLVRGDVTRAKLPGPCDLIFVGNFSIGEIHDRAVLVRYLRRCKARLARGGSFVCDTYGGQTAFTTGSTMRNHPCPDLGASVVIRYTWQQRKADPLTGMVENALHYRVLHAGEIIQELTDAFVYHWRLWSIPELRDAMHEAGFKKTSIYAKLADAIDAEGNAYVRPVDDTSELDDSFIVCVAASV